MKKTLLFISILLFSANIFAQSWPTNSGTRPSFGGFGIATEEDANSIFDEDQTSTESFAGDYITTPETKGFGDSDLTDPGNTVPIVESILGLFGLGGAYAIRLFTKRKKNEE
ncbi:MAG: hypothetical protein J6R61_02210 [Bacteroidales bacterium]|nr:hypothetical protein [Bacteroidales bacterium]